VSGDELIPPSPKYQAGGAASADAAALFVETEPLALFERWFKEAREQEPNDPNGMTLATADASGYPDARMVLLKGFDHRGFVFYSNAESAKGRELEANPRAALCFHWKSLRRQVRIRGPVSQVSDAEADAYFQSRDRGARIGAWASAQSRALEDPLALEKKVAEITLKYGLGEVPRPPFWRGWRLAPLSIEFWRDRPFRLHDRLLFVRESAAASWSKQRLYP
jgi:pyridoxamine 5'-phosphate oxidase